MNEKPSFLTAYSWFLQRITGVLLAIFLFIHIDTIHFTKEFFIDFNRVTQRLSSSGWWVVFYIIFIPVVLFHSLNGVWGIVEDYRPMPGLGKGIKAFLWVLGVCATFYGFVAITKFL